MSYELGMRRHSTGVDARVSADEVAATIDDVLTTRNEPTDVT